MLQVCVKFYLVAGAGLSANVVTGQNEQILVDKKAIRERIRESEEEESSKTKQKRCHLIAPFLVWSK